MAGSPIQLRIDRWRRKTSARRQKPRISAGLLLFFQDRPFPELAHPWRSPNENRHVSCYICNGPKIVDPSSAGSHPIAAVSFVARKDIQIEKQNNLEIE
jgi:hypothetical protein